MVTTLCQRHGVSQRDVEVACAVTPSYLSHVIAGRKQASVTLTRLVESFVANGAELDRHLAGRPWSSAGYIPFPVKAPSMSTAGFATKTYAPRPQMQPRRALPTADEAVA